MTVKEWMIATTCICLIAMIRHTTQESLQKYIGDRNTFLQAESARRTGGTLKLNSKELQVNKILMLAKQKEFDAAFSGGQFPPGQHFFKSKQLIEQSHVYQLIQKVPKGAALHLHSISITDINWIIKNITYMSDLYYCITSNGTGSLRFQFSSVLPKMSTSTCSVWLSVSEARKMYGQKVFDKWLFSKMSMWTDEDPSLVYPNATAAWKKFEQCFEPVNDLVNYANIFEAYLWQALTEFMNDNVQYMEIRGFLKPLIASDGAILPVEDAMQLFAKTVDRFVAAHPGNFSGAKFIFSSKRDNYRATVMADIKMSLVLLDKFPDHFVGYDLVGREDTGYSLQYYIKELLFPSQINRTLPYFFHAGETDWEGRAPDENLIDALLLNTTRIGHGYAITKHPVAMEVAKSKGVAVEVNPISNQVLHLVEDLRNHPAATLISQNLPLVISSDDPSIWCADPLSFDFYQAFMGLAGAKADLATLKQLAQDSIRYSAMTSPEKGRAMVLWESKWQAFLDGVLRSVR